MRLVHVAFLCVVVGGSTSYTYTDSIGACRTSDGGKAGLTLFEDTSCNERCNEQDMCTGYVTGDTWCETYYNETVSGDGRDEFTCYSKDLEPAPRRIYTYTDSIGACRTSNGGKAGLTLFEDTRCNERCNEQDMCTGYVTGDTWCETYYNETVSGDGRDEFTCYSKDERKLPPIIIPDGDDETFDEIDEIFDEEDEEFAEEEDSSDDDPFIMTAMKPLVKCTPSESERGCSVLRLTARFSLARASGAKITAKSYESAEICHVLENGDRMGCERANLNKRKQILSLNVVGLTESRLYVAVVRSEGREYVSEDYAQLHASYDTM